MKTYFSLLLILSAFCVRAQEAQLIHSGETLSEHFTFEFPAFTDGKVYFKTGNVTVAKMNYNTFLCTMQFMEPNGDTLTISDPETIDSILLNDRIYYYHDKLYFEIIAHTDSLNLVVSRKADIDVVVMGALGQPTRTASVGSFSSYITPNGWKDLSLQQDISVKKEITYFLVPKKGSEVKTSKSAFLKMFPDNKKQIESFIKANGTRFNDQGDLEKLFAFCTQHKA